MQDALLFLFPLRYRSVFCFSSFFLTGAEPQVVPAVNRVDLSSQLSATPAGTLGLSRY